ncbi:ferrous iron transport protein B [Geoglobus acetivorans]|uniref:Ferrous iron transport protein B n=1 Tax=Geoglobus acetivorans TaxID=565033 RepID=A0A0A7GAS4_GEOAI|nr:Ferrous iron transport protein B [Geoglobus acetivorans]
MHCHGTESTQHTHPDYDVLLVGNPNVGKSVIFHKLTGRYADVSNYPGTTVDILTGKIKSLNLTVADLPGMYSLFSITEEERVAKDIILNSKPKVIVNVVDAKNIERGLPLTLQLLETSFNVILVLNAVDEAEKAGMVIDEKKLEEKLGIPVIKTVAVKGKGIKELLKKIEELSKIRLEKRTFKFSPVLEEAIKEAEGLIGQESTISKKLLAILALSNDRDVIEKLNIDENKLSELRRRMGRSIAYLLAMEYQRLSEELLKDAVVQIEKKRRIYDKINELSLNPVTAIPMSIAALYFLYIFAGVIGAQIMVDAIESWYETIINVPLNTWLESSIPNYWIRELIGGEYGVVTLGLRYALAIIFPIVTMFFLAFSILEDSGFLPRMAMLLDRLFKKIGLSGRAIIPMVLGLGCGTMAVIVTRVLESRRERIIATLMLAVAIPCSAQLGIILGIVPDSFALAVWAFSVFTILLAIGLLAGKYLPGEAPSFYMEIPPLRIPSLSNIMMKTVSRLEWYFKEVLPIFLLISVAIWVGRITTVFDLVVGLLGRPAEVLGLPPKMGEIFLYGFFRRDYGTAGLYDLVSGGLLDYNQTIVSMVVLTLFVPCIAQFSVIGKERGWKFAVITALTALTIAFTAGFIVREILEVLL